MSTKAKHQIVYRADNGWTVREIRYSVIRGRLVPDCAGEKWFEVFDRDGHNHSNYRAGEQPLEAVYAVAEAGDGVGTMSTTKPQAVAVAPEICERAKAEKLGASAARGREAEWLGHGLAAQLDAYIDAGQRDHERFMANPARRAIFERIERDWLRRENSRAGKGIPCAGMN